MSRQNQHRDSSSILSILAAPYASAAGTVTASAAIGNLAILTAVNALGNGLFATISIIYYTRYLGFSVSFVSATLFAATVLAIGGDFFSGRASDASSPKPMLLSGLILSAFSTLLLVAVWNKVSFVVALCLISLGQGLCMSSNTTMVRRLARSNPALTRASLRSLLTVGISVGALVAGIVLGTESLIAFRAAILANALTFIIAAALLAGIHVPAAPPGMPGRPNPILPDRRFATFSIANGFIGIHLHALSFALPLWVVIHHPGLTWVVGVLVAVNALLVATFQVPASAGIKNINSASRRLVVGAVCIAASYLFFTTGWNSSTAALVLALAALLALHTMGEVLYSAGTMELLFRLAPESQQGQYGAFYGVSNGLVASVAPAVLGFAVATTVGWGWWLLAGLTVSLALTIRVVSLRHRDADVQDPAEPFAS